MDKNEKLNKVCNDFVMLNDDQQDYILGILQALVFARKNLKSSEPKDNQAKNRV